VLTFLPELSLQVVSPHLSVLQVVVFAEAVLTVPIRKKQVAKKDVITFRLFLLLKFIFSP
jgi:hypothetical protein